MHDSKDNGDFLRYLDLKCHLANSSECSACECGKFELGKEMKIYMKLFFVRVEQNKSSFGKRLYVYDEIS